MRVKAFLNEVGKYTNSIDESARAAFNNMANSLNEKNINPPCGACCIISLYL